MRLSTDKDDPGFADWEAMMAADKEAFVYLNGVECSRGVTTADEDAGFIVRAKFDPNGDFIVEADEVVHETVHGAVTIKIVDIAPVLD